jgi:hypothetical protein
MAYSRPLGKFPKAVPDSAEVVRPAELKRSSPPVYEENEPTIEPVF